MVKGGFQGLDISGVDLSAQSPTLPGAYATCAGADGKPIRVQTAYGQVECSVKKVSTNYVLAGITGDGKILSITIGSTDGISVSESVSGAEEYKLDILSVDIDITSATQSSPYLTENDGIVILRNNTNDTANADVSVVAKKDLSSTSVAVLMQGVAAKERKACFVRKGTYLYCTAASTTAIVKFVEYKPVQS